MLGEGIGAAALAFTSSAADMAPYLEDYAASPRHDFWRAAREDCSKKQRATRPAPTLPCRSATKRPLIHIGTETMAGKRKSKRAMRQRQPSPVLSSSVSPRPYRSTGRRRATPQAAASSSQTPPLQPNHPAVAAAPRPPRRRPDHTGAPPTAFPDSNREEDAAKATRNRSTGPRARDMMRTASSQARKGLKRRACPACRLDGRGSRQAAMALRAASEVRSDDGQGGSMDGPSARDLDRCHLRANPNMARYHRHACHAPPNLGFPTHPARARQQQQHHHHRHRFYLPGYAIAFDSSSGPCLVIISRMLSHLLS
eukprot:GHVT01024407.1.p1 GENE.GHVT01024407.1~~GHVT01024407.1.p1  ORF type:complete len:312 (-),score=41.70 GHVT01024407.1:87-1022(-)